MLSKHCRSELPKHYCATTTASTGDGKAQITTAKDLAHYFVQLTRRGARLQQLVGILVPQVIYAFHQSHLATPP
jgi:hypothetical protein